jgi:hypothetical protein
MPTRDAVGRTRSPFYGPESFTCLPDSNRYICPSGQQLNYGGCNERNRTFGYIGTRKKCGPCERRSQCTTGPFRYLAIHMNETARPAPAAQVEVRTRAVLPGGHCPEHQAAGPVPQPTNDVTGSRYFIEEGRSTNSTTEVNPRNPKKQHRVFNIHPCSQQLVRSMSGCPTQKQLRRTCSPYSPWRHFHGLREQKFPEDTDNASWLRTGRICHRESSRQLHPVDSSDL